MRRSYLFVRLLAGLAALPLVIVALHPPVHDVARSAIRPSQEAYALGLLTLESSSCHQEQARVTPDVVVRWMCTDAPVELRIERDHGRGPANWRIAGLQIQVQGEPPGELADVLGPRLTALGAPENWQDVELVPSSPQSAIEGLLAAIVVYLSCVAAAGELNDRRKRMTALGLLSLALVLRLLVTAVPMNNYSDLLTPFASFRNDPNYRPPFYSAIWLFPLGPSAVFWLNIVLGSLAAPLFFLALDGDHFARRAVLPFGIAVAVLPLYVRNAASESPHVAAMCVLAMELILVRSALAGGRGALLGVAAAAASVGAVRVELVTAPLMAVFLVLLLGGAAVTATKSRQLLVAVAAGMAYAALFSHLRTSGLPNFRPDLGSGSLWLGVSDFVHGLPSVLLLRVSYMPFALTAGSAFLIWQWTSTRKWRPLAVFVGGTALVSGHSIAGAPSFSDLSRLIPFWSMSRYPSLWLLFPVFFATWGLVELVARLRARGTRAAWLAISLLALDFAAESGWSYVSEVPYHAEYRFLRQFLTEHPNAPLSAGWTKNAGLDYCASLALPYFDLGKTSPTLAVTDGTAPEAFLRLLPDQTFFFIGAHEQITGTHEHFPVRPELKRSIASFRRLGCIARGAGELVRSEKARHLERVQWSYEDGAESLTLAIIQLNKSRIPGAAQHCPSIEMESERLSFQN